LNSFRENSHGPITSTSPHFPAIRMRRMRKDAFSRAMMRENVITAGRPDLSGVPA
jgi:hypothetical protein